MHDRRGSIRWERLPKPTGGERTIARLSPRDVTAYRLLVAPMVATIERSLGPRAFANRGTRTARVRPWEPARRAWRVAAASAMAAGDLTVVIGDVRDCYGSMGERALVALDAGDELVAFLRSLHAAGVRGLPVGPDPSAILANGILAIADRAAAAAGCRPIRWVDDVVVVAAGRRSAWRAFDAWRRTLQELGLEAHDGKTRCFSTRSSGAAFAPRTSTPGTPRRGIIAQP